MSYYDLVAQMQQHSGGTGQLLGGIGGALAGTNSIPQGFAASSLGLRYHLANPLPAEPKPDTALAWLERRVNEMRVAL